MDRGRSGNLVRMTDSTIRAVLDDGPRTGEILVLDAGPNGRPPEQVVVPDPLGMGGTEQENADVSNRPHAATTYHLHEPGNEANTYRYRTGVPD
jgi:hypothetical protein